MFVTRGKPLETLMVKAYSIDRTIPPDDYYRITKGAEWKLFNNKFSATTYGDKLCFIGNGKDPLSEFEINNYKFTLADQNILLNAKEHKIMLSQLVESSFKQKMFSLDFERSEGQKYYNKIPYKQDFFSFYDAFYSEVEVFHNFNY